MSTEKTKNTENSKSQPKKFNHRKTVFYLFILSVCVALVISFLVILTTPGISYKEEPTTQAVEAVVSSDETTEAETEEAAEAEAATDSETTEAETTEAETATEIAG